MRTVASAGVALLVACSGRDIELMLAPSLLSAPEVASRVETIEVVASSRGGLMGVTHAGPRAAGGSATDWNGDGVLEVVFVAPHHRGADLPVLELGLNENRGRALEFRVLGFPSSDVTASPIAFGGRSLEAGSTSTELGVAFDLRAEARPPQVVLAQPVDGRNDIPVSLVAVTLVFSTTIDPRTLSAITFTGPRGAVEVVPTLETETLLRGDPLEERRSVLTLRPVGQLSEGPHTLTVGEGLESTAGLGAIPFVSHFSAVSSSGVTRDGGVFCSCPHGYHCVVGLASCAADAECDGACLSGYLCDDQAAGLCVEDCRHQGLCPSSAATCGSATGLCR